MGNIGSINRARNPAVQSKHDSLLPLAERVRFGGVDHFNLVQVSVKMFVLDCLVVATG
jgi:hypothetical protein